uniref:BrkDBD domain-containing protein n=1 Tax=Angiostrongylus cantonensis TaxID=6313 RepID=A0A0K0DEX6_ANGCA
MAGGATRNARKTRKRKNSEDSTSAAPSRTLKQYSVDEKLEIIEFAKGNGNRAAGREYNVAESSIREWRKNEEKLRAANTVELERQQLPEHVRRHSADQNGNSTNEKDVEIVPVSLGSTLDSGSTLAKTSDTTTSTNQEAGSTTSSSSSSSHSNSPVFNPNSSSSSSRRKAKTPRKIVIDP